MQTSQLFCLAAIVCLATACGDGGGTTDDDSTTVLQFAVQSEAIDITCETNFRAGTGDGSYAVSDLKMYITDVELLDAAGTAVPLAFTPDAMWQTETVALLDFEDNTGGCSNGTQATNTTLRGTAPEGTYTGIRFTVGVPFEDNHADPSQATGPLTFTSMHWGWQGGYKFMRVDVTEGEGAYRLHLGSTGCEGTIGNISACSRTNRPRIELRDFDPTAQSVVLDLDRLFAQTDLAFNTDGTPAGCMAAEDDPDCEGPFAALGLGFQSGDVTGTASAFVVR